MDFVSSYDIVTEVIEKASSRLGDSYVLGDEQLDGLEKICEIIDNMVFEFECEGVNAEVDEETTRLTISVECAEIVISEPGRTHELFTLIGMCDSFCFSKAVENVLRVDFHIDNIWGFIPF